MRFILLTLTLLVFCASPVMGQKTIIDTDRPGLVPSPYTIPQGTFQAELGALNGYFREDNGSNLTVFNFPLQLRLGLTDGLELRVQSDVYQFNSADDPIGDSDGFSDITAGIKYTIPAGARVNVVVIPEVIIPVGENQGRSPVSRISFEDEVGFRTNFVARFDLGASPIELTTLVGTDVAKRNSGSDGDLKYFAFANLAARLAGNINENARLYGEVGVFPRINDFSDRYAVLGVGAKILGGEKVSFDVFGNRAFAKSAPYDWAFGVGVSTRF